MKSPRSRRWSTAGTRREESGLSPQPAKRRLGLAYNGPKVVPAEEFRFIICGEELRDVPLFFHYVTKQSEVPEHELITDVYLPLR